MAVDSIRFNESDKKEFFQDLRRDVDQYFSENNISKKGDYRMYIKSAVVLLAYLTPLAFMISGTVGSFGTSLLLWTLMGFAMAGIGLTVMHDANHGAYSKSPKVNNIMGFVLNIVGGYHVNWKIQHNVLHHSFTNIHGYDEDIDKNGIIRFSPTQPKKKLFKFQLLYAPILYSILTLYWSTAKDYEQLIKYNKRGLLKAQGVSFGQALFRIILYKLVYYFVTIALVMMFSGLLWYQVALGYLLMQMICGLILALVFQSAHVLEETEFFEPEEGNTVENSWAIHQMRTTANFANNNPVLTWMIGGLNHQVEHHLFPTICHIHYPAVSKIVRKNAKKHNVPYLEHKTFIGAIYSHFKMLGALGSGKI
jgi:linoleoyl-CoA desaturase